MMLPLLVTGLLPGNFLNLAEKPVIGGQGLLSSNEGIKCPCEYARIAFEHQ